MTNVSKKYPNGVTAIKDLSLTIEPGEFAYIVGPSGAGKSTFIKMLYHQLKATMSHTYAVRWVLFSKISSYYHV